MVAPLKFRLTAEVTIFVTSCPVSCRATETLSDAGSNEGDSMGNDTYKLKVVRSENGEIEIIGNRAGLKDLADVCQKLSELSDEDAKTGANHYHIADYMSNAEDGSLELIILYKPDF
jgi:hypothetical protein